MGSRNRNPLIIDAFQVRFLIFSYVNIVLTFFINRPVRTHFQSIPS